jgi:DNA-binding CsgD family transcriptional regulator
MAAQAMGTGELNQLTHVHDGVAHACLHVPIVGSGRTLGFFGIGVRGTVPIETWRAEMIWATADLMALLVLELDGDNVGDGAEASALGSLTLRQREVLLDLVEHGEGNAQIADRLGMHALTVKVHLQAIYRKLGVHNRAEAISTVLNEHRGWLAKQHARRREWPGAV